MTKFPVVPKIAALQMSSTDNVQHNLQTVSRLLKSTPLNDVACVVLPENVAFIGKTETEKLSHAEDPGQGPIQDTLSALAKELNVWIVGGTIPIKVDNDLQKPNTERVYASSFVWDNHGNVKSQYNKIHLFDVQVEPGTDPYFESKTIFPGKEIVTVQTPFGKLGLSVCYDLRFPELYRALFAEGAEILMVPSAFTAVTGRAHWETLLRARAIENLSYVIAPNQSGTHPNGRATYGHSMIIEPWGKILASLPEGEGVITAEIDLSHLKEIRTRFPVDKHRIIGK